MTDILDLIDATLAECTAPHVSAGPSPPPGADIWAQVRYYMADLERAPHARGLLAAREAPAVATASPLENLKDMYERLRDQRRPDRGRYLAFSTPYDPRSAALEANEFAGRAARFLDDIGLDVMPWQRTFLEDISISHIEPVDFFRDDAIRFRVAMRYRVQDPRATLALVTAPDIDIGVVRVDSLPLKAGRLYRVEAGPAPAPRSARIHSLRGRYRHRQLARRRRARR